MSTLRIFQCIGAIISSNLWDTVGGGDTLQYVFSEGAWVPQWTGSYNPTVTLAHITIGAQIVADLGVFYEVPQPESAGNPPVAILQSTIQALIDAGSTITTIGGSTSNNFNGRITAINPATPTTLAELAAMQWTYTVNSTTAAPTLSLTFANGQINLDVPDTFPLVIEGEGGIEVIEVINSESAELVLIPELSEIMILDPLNSGGIIIGDDIPTPMVLSADISGIYTLVKNKTNDTLYERTGFSVFIGTEDVKIPNPFIKTAFIGG